MPGFFWFPPSCVFTGNQSRVAWLPMEKQTNMMLNLVCVSVCIILACRMQNIPHLSSYIVSRVLPWWCIPGQGLALIHTDPGWWPLTFRPWPGSKGQRWPEGNKSTSMIGILTCSLPPSSAALTSLPSLHLSFAFVTERRPSGEGVGGGWSHRFALHLIR